MQLPLHVTTYRVLNVKMNIAKGDLLHEPLKFFWFAGLHPSKIDSIIARTFILFYVSGSLFIFFLAAKGSFVFLKTDLFFTAECLQTCILMLHACGKVINLYCHRDRVLKLLDMYSKFWKLDDFTGTVKEECVNLYTNIKTFVHRYFCISVVCIFFFVFKPPACYIPEGFQMHVSILYGFLFYGLALSVVATDGLFCLLGTAIIVQFKLLGYKFRNVNAFLRTTTHRSRDHELWKRLRFLVDHHNFLYTYCELTDRVFSGPFFIQFLASNGSAAISSFILTQGGSWNNILKFLLFCIILISQTIFYCLPAEFIRNASEQINSDIYESKWYDSDITEFKRSIVIILTKTQKMVTFSAYGLVFINLKTLIVISKTAFSFYTYLSSVKKLKLN